MGQKDCMIGVSIPVVYQGPNSALGLSPVLEILDETGTPDLVNFPDVILAPIASKPDRYAGVFVPDAPGDWKITVHDGTGKGKSITHFSVGSWNVHEVGQAVASTAAAILDLHGDVVTVASAVADLQGDVTSMGTQVDNVHTDLGTAITKLDNLQADVDGLESQGTPPILC